MNDPPQKPERPSKIAPWKFVLLVSFVLGTVIFVAVLCGSWAEMKAAAANAWQETHVLQASEWVYDLAYTPDGSILATTGQSDRLELWNTADNTLKKSLKGPRDTVQTLVISSNGKWMASGGDDRSIWIWDLESETQVAELKGHREVVISVAFSNDSTVLVSGSEDGSIRFWDRKNQKELHEITLGYSINTVATSPTQPIVTASGVNSDILVLDINTHELITTFLFHKQPVTSLAFSHDGKFLASVSNDGRIAIWDMTALKLHKEFGDGFDSFMSVRFSPDDRLIVTGTAHDLEYSIVEAILAEIFGFGSTQYHGLVILWDVRTGKQLAVGRSHTDWVRSAVFSPDGKQVATASDDATIRIWDVPSKHR